jgi:hypothetical protein
MTIRRMIPLALLCALATAPALARPPESRLALLRAGISITNWFRFPPHADVTSLRAYLSNPALLDLRDAGFTVVRLPVQPELLWQDGMIEPGRLQAVALAVHRLQTARLAVVVDLQPATWHLEASATDRLRLVSTWKLLARALAGLDQATLFPEVLNEPVFADDPAAWEALQAETLAAIRASLPAATVVLTGGRWGGVDGLLALHPVADPNVVYSVHFYEPMELTALAAYRPGLDQAALARLPFPAGDAAHCRDRLAGADATTGAVGGWYCGGGWDAAHIAARLDAVAGWARAHDAAVWIGEFGATRQLNLAARLAWLGAVRGAAEARHIGWALWGYEDVMGLGVPVPPGLRPTLDRGTLAALGLGASK